MLGGLLQRFDFALDTLCQDNFCCLKVISGLQAHPTLCVGTEEACEAQGGVGRDGSLAGANFIDAALGHSDGLCEPVAGDLHRDEKILKKDFTGVNRRKVAFNNNSSSFSGNRYSLHRGRYRQPKKSRYATDR